METKDLAVLGLILAFFVPIAGLIIGAVALSKIKNQGGEGKGAAIAAIIIGCLGFVIVPIMFFTIFMAYFGVVSPTPILPEKCELQMGLRCVDFMISSFDDNIQIKLQNGMGQGILLTSMTATGTGDAAGVTCTKEYSGESWEGKPGLHIENGDTGDVILDCTSSISELKRDEKQRFNLEIVYYNDASEKTYSHTMNGRMMAEVVY
ncbi:MAG: DUF4190 domain-containing protein [bacterium]|nr:DUF4190 domain-containing protein [bacterium]